MTTRFRVSQAFLFLGAHALLLVPLLLMFACAGSTHISAPKNDLAQQHVRYAYLPVGVNGAMVQVPFDVSTFSASSSGASMDTTSEKAAGDHKSTASPLKGPGNTSTGEGSSDSSFSFASSSLNVFYLIGGLLLIAAAVVLFVPQLSAFKGFASAFAVAGASSLVIGWFVASSPWVQFLLILPLAALLTFGLWKLGWFKRFFELGRATAAATLKHPDVKEKILAETDGKDPLTLAHLEEVERKA